MSIKLTANLNDPPISGLAIANLISKTNNVEVSWGSETTLVFPDNSSFVCYSNNDVLRALARTAPQYKLYGETPIEKTQIDHWLSFGLTCIEDTSTAMSLLDKSIAPVTFLVANKLTIADFALFNEIHQKYELLKSGMSQHVQRWYNLILAQPTIQQVLQSLPEEARSTLKNKPKSVSKDRPNKTGERKQEGKFIDLPGAEMGKVVVRFPPEASGYLHIGHAKAALLNQYYQQAFDGKLIMRFDDTNPAKETIEFEEVILEDLKMLQIEPDIFTHTSNYFDLMLEYCETLLKNGKAYVDDTDPETMKKEREQRTESKNRNNTPETNLAMWKEMVQGTEKGQKCCVRAKIDMSSPNGCLRDPTIYRCKNEPHPRTGTKYKVYPTYDFACPIVDAIENVTHTLRTMEYHDRDDQFYWFIEALNLRKPYIWEYSRLNMTNTVLSKRKLTWFVNEGLVDGWDDPRFPTVRGILRRGMTVEGLKEFIIAQGSSKSVVFMNWDKIWAFNKKVIDQIAPRYTALECKDHVVVNVDGAKLEKIQVAAHPKNESVGLKDVWVGPQILIDNVDAETLKENENATFINWGNLFIKKIHKSNGKITSIDANLNLDNKDFKKTVKLTWLAKLSDDSYPKTYCVYFDNIISKAVLGKDEDFKQYIGHKTREEVEMLGDPELKKCKKGDIIQLQRRGFFKVDNAYSSPSFHTGIEGPVILFSIPDGHTKDVSSSGLKLSNTEKASVKPISSNSADLENKISVQGEIVRKLKLEKVPKDQIEIEVKKLLALKADYKSQTGSDYKPLTKPTSLETNSSNVSVGNINENIKKQGELVRDLKAKKAPKDEVASQVKILLDLKAQYKKSTGTDWKPESVAVLETSGSASNSSTNVSAVDINENIKKQGELVRDLKAKKATKDEVAAQVKILLDLKAQYKESTGTDWKPESVAVLETSGNASNSSTNVSAVDINENIKKQGELVRDLKAKKATKDEVAAQVKILLDLKAQYKESTGTDWKPETVGVLKTGGSPSNVNVVDINENIRKQGDIVRDLKAKKATKDEVAAQVKILLDLKAQYKKSTGIDWKPESVPVLETSTSIPNSATSADIADKIVKQGDKIRALKSAKADKSTIDIEVKTLLALKAEYKIATGTDWTPSAGASGSAPNNVKTDTIKVDYSKPVVMSEVKFEEGSINDELTKEIIKQGEKVRQLKSSGGLKPEIEVEVIKLINLKAKYKEITGTDFPTAGRSSGGDKKKSEQKDKKENQKAKQKHAKKDELKAEGAGGALKKQTRLGLEATKEENLSDWYSQVITKGELIEYYDVSGCYILRHWSFAIWKFIKNWFDCEITKLGVKECYFPIFVSKAALEREKDHIADFAPEVAWVTKSGESDLAEPIAVRPTSETVMYPAYAKWIQSYRDLPIRLNQWNNVVRWEFKHPQPFLRTREFLWQEGHTAFATKEEADDEVLTILDLYAQVYTYLLAIPVVKGRKTEKEKFAGGDYTTTVEAFISASGRAIQGATSHHLGQNFSKMFDIVYEDPETQTKQYVYQNSWGITTRTIGVMIMVHADNKGLVLPPHVACIQAIIVPCGVTVSMRDEEKEELLACCVKLEKLLNNNGIRCEGDYRENYSPGWKFNHWELKGVPIRIEIGPKDMKSNQMVAVRRDTGEKLILACDDAEKKIEKLLETIHESMLAKAKGDLIQHTKITKNWGEFCKLLDQKNIIMSPFCGDSGCEEKIKGDSAREEDAEPGAPAMGAKSLCIPFEQPTLLNASDKCIHPSCNRNPKFYTLFGRSY